LRPDHLRREEVARPSGGGRAPAGKEVVSPSSPFFRSRAGRGGVAPKTGEARCRCLPSLQCCVIAVDRYPGDPNSERMSAGWGVEEVERESCWRKRSAARRWPVPASAFSCSWRRGGLGEGDAETKGTNANAIYFSLLETVSCEGDCKHCSREAKTLTIENFSHLIQTRLTPSRWTHLSGCVMTKKGGTTIEIAIWGAFLPKTNYFSHPPRVYPPFIPAGPTKSTSKKLPCVCAHPPASPYPAVRLLLCPLPLPPPRRRTPYSTRRLTSGTTDRAHGGARHA
jgi:hypothetical protein